MQRVGVAGVRHASGAVMAAEGGAELGGAIMSGGRRAQRPAPIALPPCYEALVNRQAIRPQVGLALAPRSSAPSLAVLVRQQTILIAVVIQGGAKE